jgi:hypothetical protein
MPFSKTVRDEVILRSKRHCCVCRIFAGRDLSVHHIVQEADGGPDTLDNAIALCSRCHGEAGHYNPRHPLGTKYSHDELRRHRDSWWQVCETVWTPPVQDTSTPQLPGSVRKKVGILWSDRADIDAEFEIVVFDADLLGRTRFENLSVVRFRELYRRGQDYIVYEESIHRGDWAEAVLVHKTASGTPLSLDDVQREYPELATRCGLHRTRRI